MPARKSASKADAPPRRRPAARSSSVNAAAEGREIAQLRRVLARQHHAAAARLERLTESRGERAAVALRPGARTANVGRSSRAAANPASAAAKASMVMQVRKKTGLPSPSLAEAAVGEITATECRAAAGNSPLGAPREQRADDRDHALALDEFGDGGRGVRPVDLVAKDRLEPEGPRRQPGSSMHNSAPRRASAPKPRYRPWDGKQQPDPAQRRGAVPRRCRRRWRGRRRRAAGGARGRGGDCGCDLDGGGGCAGRLSRPRARVARGRRDGGEPAPAAGAAGGDRGAAAGRTGKDAAISEQAWTSSVERHGRRNGAKRSAAG